MRTKLLVSFRDPLDRELFSPHLTHIYTLPRVCRMIFVLNSFPPPPAHVDCRKEKCLLEAVRSATSLQISRFPVKILPECCITIRYALSVCVIQTGSSTTSKPLRLRARIRIGIHSEP